jgi:hypothetical protein
MTMQIPAISAAIFGIASLTVAASIEPLDAQSDEAALVQIQHALAKAWVAGDRAAIERIIAPEWHGTAPDGRQRDRDAVLREVFESRVHRIHGVEVDELRIQVFDDAAVVTGRTHGVGEFEGTPYDVFIRFTDTFVRRSGHWQAVASHASLLSTRQP